MNSSLRALASVFKLRIGFAIAVTAVAGAAVAPGPQLPAWKILVLALAVLGASAAAGAFNQYIERDLDARMSRTQNRPFVTGFYDPSGAFWPAGLALLLILSCGAAAVLVGPMAALHVFLGAFVYGVVYTLWLKRRTWLNIVIGGLAGSFAVLAGAAAVDPAPAAAPLLLALVLFLWTPPHFWSLAMARRDDYAAAGVPMLPVVKGDAAAARAILLHTIPLVALSLAPAWFGLGLPYLIAAATGGAVFLWYSIRLVRAPGPKAAMANFFASLLQLTLLLGGAILEFWT
ncbi:MAG: protoheme IX farnesyltransferase [Alphaproteobacteria bacterium]|nr:protoheme IX farnesyltransferase [Alphaproteobacteria bacterium]